MAQFSFLSGRAFRMRSLFVLIFLSLILSPLAAHPALAQDGGQDTMEEAAASPKPVVKVSQRVSQEPLLGGQVAYTIRINNTGTRPVTDKGYNLTISDVLPAGLAYLSASPSPTAASQQADGTTQLVWDNLADLEVNESMEVAVIASLANTLTVAAPFTNNVVARLNKAPDNSGQWVEESSQLTAQPQTLDLEVTARQSTAVEQATGAGEHPGQVGRQAGADWAYQYEVSMRNNNVGPSENTVVRVTLPAGVAYLGGVVFANNPTNAAVDPVLTLRADGQLDLTWTLGTLTTAQYADPVLLRFNAAIPYRLRTGQDAAAAAGPFAGPMTGSVITEDTALAANYEATATYAAAPTSDGSESTPADDSPAAVTAEIMAVQKTAAPDVAGIGTAVTFALNTFVSEYYTVTNGLLVDVLPDGMTYVNGSANLAPAAVATNQPVAGQTTITWTLPATATLPGAANSITFQATVDPTYEGGTLAGQPVVSGDRLTNQATASGEWRDALDFTRLGTLTPDTVRAEVGTRMPSFDKKVRDPLTNEWVSAVDAFVGDTLTFRLTYAAAADVDAKAIIIRDFLPRGMTYVAGSATHAVSGSFTNGPGCTAAPQAPTVGTLSGLQYLEWRLCNTARGATWQVELQARVGPVPTVQPGWIVANFGKLSGQNSYGAAYSLRAMANTNYKAPLLVLDKSVSPATNLQAGSVITYTIQVTNGGKAPAYNLVVSDTLPVSLTVANSGGWAGPTAATYTTLNGNPGAGRGGVIQWSSVPNLPAGATQTYRYTAVIPAGLVAGQSLTNIATVSYNSRADNQGHQVSGSAVLTDDQTDDATAYLKGLTVVKSAQLAAATIGDRVRWVLTGTVPAGVRGYWPVVEENDLPAGFDYLAGSTVVTGAALDTWHPQNPRDDGDRDLRWYLQSLDNAAGVTDMVFTIQFDTLVTGVNGKQKGTQYYTNNAIIDTADNTAYVGWYDTASGYSGTGHAWNGGFEINRIDRRSAGATFTVSIRQPYLTLQKTAARSIVGAGDVFSYTLVLANTGNDVAYDIALKDVLPKGIALAGVDSVQVNYPAGFVLPPEPQQTHVVPTSIPGAALAYAIDRLYVGSSVTVVYRGQVSGAVSADLTLTNTASVPQYSSKQGVPADSNGDGLADERTYTGPSASISVRTPSGSIQKTVEADELTYGSTLVYRITVPAQPINATLYNVDINDDIDRTLDIVSVTNGKNSSFHVRASFASIPPGRQQVVVVTAALPLKSKAAPGTVIRNTASVSYDNDGTQQSNEVANTIVAPALTIDKTAAQADVQAGGTVDYTLIVRNVGSGRAEKVQVADTLPVGFRFQGGTAQLNGQPLGDPANGLWDLPALSGGAEHVITFQAVADAAEPGKLYVNTAAVRATDSRGQPIPADNSGRVPADIDPDDAAKAPVYGPLTWKEESTYVAYEDLKNVGWSDWDYNDFIVKMDVSKGLTPDDSLAALRLRYEPLSHGGAYNHRFNHQLPVYGGGVYSLSVYDADGKLQRQAAGAFRDEPAITIFENTKVAMPLPVNPPFDLIKFPFSNTMQEQEGTVKGYTADLLVVLDQAAANPSDALPPLPWDPYLYVYNTKQEIHLVQPGHLDNTQVVNNAYDPGNPLLGFDLPLANTFLNGWQWPQEFLGVWRVYPAYVTFVTTDGAKGQSWWDSTKEIVNLDFAWHAGNHLNAAGAQWTDSAGSRYFAGPLLADLDGDGQSEIIIGNLVQWQLEVYNADGSLRSGWPRSLQGEVKAPAAAADLDGDGKLEIVVGDAKGYLHALRENGEPLAGWPIKVGPADQTFRILSRPALADLNSDGRPEVILALSDGKLYVYAADGALLGGWPQSIGDAADTYGNHVIDSSPVVADIDGDGSLEIVVGAYDKAVYAYHADGSLAWRFATNDVVLATPAVADIDPAQPGLETVIASGDRFVYLLDKDGAQIWKRPTGWIVRSSPLVADIDGDGSLEILVGSDDHKVWAWHADGSIVSGWPQAAGAAVSSSPVLADVDGDGVLEIVIGSDDTNLYAWKADGTLVTGWPINVEYPVKGAPAAGNLDGDPEWEVVAANFDGVLKYVNMVPNTNTGGNTDNPGNTGEFSVFLPIVQR